MSTLADRINSDIKQAMLSKDGTRLSALRMLKSAIMNFEINKKGESITDVEVQGIIQKQIKQRKESIEQYDKGGRADLAQTEQAEITVFESYVPAQMSDSQLEATVREALTQNTIHSKKEFGKAMKILQDKVKGSADNKRVSDILNKVLA